MDSILGMIDKQVKFDNTTATFFARDERLAWEPPVTVTLKKQARETQLAS